MKSIPIRHSLARAFAVAGLAAGLVTVLPFMAGTASAHHSEIKAEVNCNGLVSWTATSWEPNYYADHRGENPDVRVYLQIEDEAKVQIATGEFTAANNFRFSGTFTWPMDDTNHLASYVYVSSKPMGTWGNGNTSHDGQSVKVYAPSDCPGEPGATVQSACIADGPLGFGSGVATVTLSNGDDPWGPTVEFRVYNPDQTTVHTHYWVAPGVDQTVMFNGLNPDGDHTILVETKHTYAGFPKTLTVNVDCDGPAPAVQLTPSCTGAVGAVLVTMTNTGAESVTFDVTNPLDLVVSHVVVAAGGTETLTFTGFTNGDYTVTVMAGTVDLSKSFTADCEVAGEGSLHFTQACLLTDGAIELHLVATGGTVPTDFVVEGTTYSVAPDGEEIVQIAGLGDGVRTIAVMMGTTDLSFQVTVACDEGTESGSELPDTGGGGIPTWPAMVAIGSGALLLMVRRIGRHAMS